MRPAQKTVLLLATALLVAGCQQSNKGAWHTNKAIWHTCNGGNAQCNASQIVTPIIITIIITVVLVFAAAIIGLLSHINRTEAGLAPPEPADISLAMISPLIGQNVPAYAAKVDAVTSAGMGVWQSRCCVRGHQTPGLATAHANAIKQRIETTGR